MLQKKRPASDSSCNIGRESAPTSDSRLTWTFNQPTTHNHQASGHCPHLPLRQANCLPSSLGFLFLRFWQCLLFTMWFSAGLSALGLASLAWGAVRTDDEGNTIKSIGVRLFCHFSLCIGTYRTKMLTILRTVANTHAATGERPPYLGITRQPVD